MHLRRLINVSLILFVSYHKCLARAAGKFDYSDKYHKFALRSCYDKVGHSKNAQ